MHRILVFRVCQGDAPGVTRQPGPKRKPPASYHHGDLRRALLDAALQEVGQNGLGQLSLRALARVVGVSPRAPYNHFASKEELLAAVAVEGFAEQEAQLRARLEAAGDDVRERLAVTGEVYVTFAAERPAHFRVMYAPHAHVAENAPALVAVRERLQKLFLETIVAGQRTGVIREGDPMQIALACWSMVHGLAVLLIEGQLGRYDRPLEARKLARLVARLLQEGLEKAHG